MSQLIAIVGRPNVGKSTLFNRLTQTRTAITNDEAGTTRDRQYGKVEWVGKEFSIVDTGGWVIGSEDVFESEINKQVQVAIEQADEIPAHGCGLGLGRRLLAHVVYRYGYDVEVGQLAPLVQTVVNGVELLNAGLAGYGPERYYQGLLTRKRTHGYLAAVGRLDLDVGQRLGRKRTYRHNGEYRTQ